MLPSCCDARWPSALHMSGLVSPHTDTREISTLLGGGGLTISNEVPYGHVGLDLFCASIITCWAHHTELAPNTAGYKTLTELQKSFITIYTKCLSQTEQL